MKHTHSNLTKWSMSSRIFHWISAILLLVTWLMIFLYDNLDIKLYALLIAMPIAGLMMSLYGGRPVDVFGLFQIPVFVTPDRALARLYNDWHTDIIWPIILTFTALHIGAALYHQFIKKDNLMSRMK